MTNQLKSEDDEILKNYAAMGIELSEDELNEIKNELQVEKLESIRVESK